MKLRSIALIVALFASFIIAAKIGAEHGIIAGASLAAALFVVASAIVTPREAAVFNNNFGVLNNTIVVANAFSLLLEQLLPLRNLVLDTQDEKSGIRTGKPGDTITVKDWRTTVTAYQPAPTYTASDVDISAGDRQLTLPTAPWAISITLTAAEYRLLASGATGGAEYTTFMNKIAQLMANGLGKKLIDLWFAVVTAANYTTNFFSAAGTFSRSKEVDLETKLFGRNVPSDGAQVIGSPALYAEWVKDHVAIQTNTGENRPLNLLMGGGVRSQNTPLTFWRTNRTMPADALRGFATTRTSVIAAFRIPDEATFERDPVSLSVIIDPATDIPLLARLHKVTTTGAIQLDLATMPVFGKGQTEGLERISENADA